jgi:Flavin containing amine oxidoreductase
MSDVDVVIVGGGISGLSAARELCRQGFRVRLLEREAQCGGVIQTRRVGNCVVDVGPDTLLGHKPAALALCKELGLEDQLVGPGSPRTTFVLRSGKLQPLPETSMLGLPANWTSLIGTRAFTWRGKLRMAAEALVPPARLAVDESIASFVGRRFGGEAVKSLAEPLLAGIHRGDASRLSMRALFPALLDAERQHGSVVRALSRKKPGSGRAGSMSLRGGIGQLVERLEGSLPGTSSSPALPCSASTAVVRSGFGSLAGSRSRQRRSFSPRPRRSRRGWSAASIALSPRCAAESSRHRAPRSCSRTSGMRLHTRSRDGASSSHRPNDGVSRPRRGSRRNGPTARPRTRS